MTEMGSTQTVLAQLWLYAFLLGVGLGAVYDVFRITRVFLGVSYTKAATERLQSIRLPYLSSRPPRRPSRILGVVVFFEDFLFALIGGVSIILLFYQVNNGKIRFPAFFLAALGFFLYRITIGRVIMLASQAIAFGIEILVRYAIFFIMLPFRWIGKQISTLCKHLWSCHVTHKTRRARRRTTARAWKELKRNGGGLIPPSKTREHCKGGALWRRKRKSSSA